MYYKLIGLHYWKIIQFYSTGAGARDHPPPFIERLYVTLHDYS